MLFHRQEVGWCPDPMPLGNTFDKAWHLGTKPVLLLTVACMGFSVIRSKVMEKERVNKEGREEGTVLYAY